MHRSIVLALTVLAVIVAAAPVGCASPAREDPEGQTLFKAIYKDPEKFIRVQWSDGMPYTYARQLLGKESVPALERMLSDLKYRDYWHKVAEALGYASDDPKTVRVLLGYVRRPEEWSHWNTRDSGFHAVMGKIRSLEWIGRIGGPEAEAALREMVTAAGAEAVVAGWRVTGELPEVYAETPGHAADLLRGRAAQGLVFTGNPAAIRLVEEMYATEHARCAAGRQVTSLYDGLVEAMAEYDYIRAHGNRIEAYFETIGQEHYLDKMEPFIRARAWYLQKPDAPKGPPAAAAPAPGGAE
jgi:hypothetical protein